MAAPTRDVPHVACSIAHSKSRCGRTRLAGKPRVGQALGGGGRPPGLICS